MAYKAKKYKRLFLSKDEQDKRTRVYADLDKMIEQREMKRPHFSSEFGQRTAMEYWNDCDRRVNGETLSREEQGKDDWQSNFFNPVTRTKLKTLIAGIALSVPQMSFRAVNKNGMYSAQRAELMRQLVNHSRLQGHPSLDIFFEAWEAAAKGTVIKYDGYVKSKYERKFISEYDIVTGEIKFDTREEVVEDEPIDMLVPLSEFYIWDFFIYDVQKQPKLAWVQHYNKEDLEKEFGQYKNFNHIKDKATARRFNSSEINLYMNKWEARVDDNDDYEVIRYYNKFEDCYEIWCNGVPLLIAPLVWGKSKKMYPFSKTIFEPFVGYNFFYGKSLPSVLEGIQDTANAGINSVFDSWYRDLNVPLLIGLENKDILDVEDELVSQDNKIYVPNVNAVKPMPSRGVNQADMAMLEYIARLGDIATFDTTQSGVQGKGVTAREVIIADERARELKGSAFMFLEDLWLQKTRLRVLNVITNYMQPRIEKIVGKDGSTKLRDALTVINIPDVEFSDGTMGVLGVQIAKDKGKMLKVKDIEAREDVMEQNGINYKMIAVTSDYLDNWEYDFEIVTSSIANQDRVRKEAEFEGKAQTMAALFPEYLAENKEKMFNEFINIYGEGKEDWKQPKQQQPQEEGLGLELPPEQLPTNDVQNATPTANV